MKKRLDYIDSISGIMIVYMISYHILQLSGYNVSNILLMRPLLCIFMPWFFFKSGMFHKNYTLRDVIKKNFKKLVIPFIVFSFIGYVIYCLNLYVDGDTNWIRYTLSPIKEFILLGAIYGNAPLWFLLSLYLVKCISCLTLRGNIVITLITMGFAIIIPIYIFPHINYPKFLGNVCIGYVFYSLGFYLKDKQFSIYVLLTSLVCYFTIFFLCYSNVDVNQSKLLDGNFFLWYIIAISGCVTINNIFYRYDILNNKYLKIIGKNSMQYYVIHWPLLMIISMLFKNHLDNNAYTAMLFVGCIISLPISSYLYNKFCNKYITL